MLTERVTIEVNTPVDDGQGGKADSWAAIDADSTDIGARVRVMSGAEARYAMRIAPRAAYTALIYYRADAYGAPFYTPKHRLTWRGRIYNILHTADYETRSIYMYLLLNEGDLS
jgi:SPP1 family predicted phage head-tail adaptor